MRDKHPIDDLFREALLRASVAPPPHLAEAILGAAQRRRRGAFWFRRRYVLGGLVLLGVAGSGLGLWLSHGRGAGDLPGTITERTATTQPVQTGATGAQSEEAQTRVPPEGEGVEQPFVAPTETPEKDQPMRSGAQSLADRSSPAGNRAVPDEPEHKAAPALADPFVFPVQPDPSTARTPVQEENEAPAQRATLDHLLPRSISPTEVSATLVSAPPTDRYVLPSGDWWVGINVGAYASHRNWSGAPSVLSDALNESEAWTSTLAIGAMGGRAWRSGFGFGFGLENERSQQAYRHVDRTTSYETVVNTQMVTLNTLVFYTNSDTVITPSESERVSAGTDKRTTWRIPVEAFWHQNFGRWFVGARCGVAGEFTRVTASASLVNDEVLGGVRSTTLEANELVRRYPFTLVGVVGADIGFSLHERWTVTASPLYMSGLFHTGDSNSVTSSPERAGARFQLCYIL